MGRPPGILIASQRITSFRVPWGWCTLGFLSNETGCFARVCQKRNYTPPSKRTWSKQHQQIFTPRPLSDPFAMHKLHPDKKWWRERRERPSTFMGFPDVTKASLRGTSTLIEQMDPVTLSVVLDKCVKEQVKDESIWDALSRQAQRIVNQINEPSLGYIYRSFALKGWLDKRLTTSLLGRIQQRIPAFQCRDCATILTAMSDDRFRHDECMAQILEHVYLLLLYRNDLVAEELAYLLACLRDVKDAAPKVLISLAGQAILRHDFGLVSISSLTLTLDSMLDLKCDSDALKSHLVETLRRRLNECDSKDLLRIARFCAEEGLADKEFVDTALKKLSARLSELTPTELCTSAYCTSKCGKRSFSMFQEFRRSLNAVGIDALTPADLCRALFGFVKAGRELDFAPDVLAPAIVKSMDSLDSDSLLLVLESASVSTLESKNMEDIASVALCRLHDRLQSLKSNQLAVLSKITSRLDLEAEGFLNELFATCLLSLNELNFRELAMVARGLGGLRDDLMLKHLPCAEFLAACALQQLKRSLKQSPHDIVGMLSCFSRYFGLAPRETAVITEAVCRLSPLLKNSVKDLSSRECVSAIELLSTLPNVVDNRLISEAEEQLSKNKYNGVTSDLGSAIRRLGACQPDEQRFDQWYIQAARPLQASRH